MDNSQILLNLNSCWIIQRIFARKSTWTVSLTWVERTWDSDFELIQPFVMIRKLKEKRGNSPSSVLLEATIIIAFMALALILILSWPKTTFTVFIIGKNGEGWFSLFLLLNFTLVGEVLKENHFCKTTTWILRSGKFLFICLLWCSTRGNEIASWVGSWS